MTGMETEMRTTTLAWLLALASPWAGAQTVPTLDSAGGQFVLELPYLEGGQAEARQAWRATLRSADLMTFTLDAASVASVALLPANALVPRAESISRGWRIAIPYLETRLRGSLQAFAVNLDTADVSRFAADAASVRELPVQAASPPTAVTVGAVNLQTVGGTSFGSSTRLQVSWAAPAGVPVDHYEISASEPLLGTPVSTRAAASATSVTLTSLNSATSYSVVVRACLDAACTRAAGASPVSGTTAAEYWQLQGSGHTVATLRQPVADGNVRLSATRYGADAGATASTVQLYYGPRAVSGLAVATTATVSAASPDSYLAFTSLASSTGVRSPSAPGSGIRQINTGQGVPLSAALGGRVRLFFESTDTDGKTRIYSVDSVDGWLGRDFNRSSTASVCSAAADYQAGGNCAVTLQIGVDGETGSGTSRIRAARQHKLAWPTQDDWRWDGAAGSFMVFTVDAIAGCSTASHNHAYAVWDGSRFAVQTASDGCPKLIRSAQAAVPMHLGGVRYKLLFGDPSVTTGKVAGSGLPFVGPKKLIYADGARAGAASTVDFEDWEPVSAARPVHFLWPDGQRLDDTAAGYIDDFHVLAPTGDLDLQVLYVSITDGTVIPFSAVAVLRNP